MMVKPLPRPTTTALGRLVVGLACLGAPVGSAAQEVAPLRLDPAVARCILDRLYGIETPIAAELLYKACRALVSQDGAGGGLMVHCRVPGDPSWIETRLVTREQCARAGGTADR